MEFGFWVLGFDRDAPGDELAAVHHDSVHPPYGGPYWATVLGKSQTPTQLYIVDSALYIYETAEARLSFILSTQLDR